MRPVSCALAAAVAVLGCTGSKARVCVPGQSVACVGPGGCEGGQSCSADGSSYLACVCAAGSSASSGSSSGGSIGASSSGSTGGAGSTGGGATSGSSGGGCHPGALSNPCTTQVDCSQGSPVSSEACVPSDGGADRCLDESLRSGPTCSVEMESVQIVASDTAHTVDFGSFFLRAYFALDAAGARVSCARLATDAAHLLPDGGDGVDGDTLLNRAYWGGLAADAGPSVQYFMTTSMLAGAGLTLRLDGYGTGLPPVGVPAGASLASACLDSQSVGGHTSQFFYFSLQ